MLDADEISELAKLRNVKPWQEEKRYVLCLLLYALSEEKIILKVVHIYGFSTVLIVILRIWTFSKKGSLRMI